jgi:tetratricopeptide (TPR) repeat protein
MSERAWILALAVVLLAAPALAAPSAADKVEARKHFDAGVAYAKQGAYDAALTEFTRAYDLAPTFVVLYNVAKAREELGQPVEAIAAYQRYLADGGAAVPAERRAKVTAQVKELEGRVGTIKLHVSPDTAKVFLDGASVDPAAAAHGIRVNPGAHRVAAAAEGYADGKQELAIDHGGVFEVTLALAPLALPQPAVPLPAPAPSPQPSQLEVIPPLPGPATAPPGILPRINTQESGGSAQRAIGYTVAAAGIAALATGGILYLVALSDRQKAIDAGCTATSCIGQGASYWGDARDNVTRSRIAAIAGGVLVAGGLTVVLIAPATHDAPAGVMLGGRF